MTTAQTAVDKRIKELQELRVAVAKEMALGQSLGRLSELNDECRKIDDEITALQSPRK